VPRSRIHDKRLAEAIRKALKTPIVRAPMVPWSRSRLLLAFLAAELADEYPNFASAIRDALEHNL